MLCALLISSHALAGGKSADGTAARHVIVMVWDGLRPTAINPTDTPNLHRLRERGVDFTDHHATYPTLTMINAASFATGNFPEHNGFYGNSAYVPNAQGADAAGEEVQFKRPTFLEDYAILEALDRYYGNALLKSETLMQRVQREKLATVAVGKTGPAFLQDYHRGGAILDENHVWPRALAESMQQAGSALPLRTPMAYPGAVLRLSDDNGDPTGLAAAPKLRDDAASDPDAGVEAIGKIANRYLMTQFIEHLLPERLPTLSFVWLREPDQTEHVYGPGARAVRDALRNQDALLGELRAKLAALKMEGNTDLIVVSDHGHSTVSGPHLWFPPRLISNGTLGRPDRMSGYSASGEIRLAELLRHADPGLDAYDDKGCMLAPSLSGIRGDGQAAQPTRVDDSGAACRTPGTKYTSAVPAIPDPAGLGERSIVIASNGGSEYLYLPKHNAQTLARVVRVLQTREQIGAIFVSQRRYPELPAGTLSMESIRIESGDERSPDLVVSYAYDADQMLHGAAGIEFASMYGSRGMHGSFSPRDVHNTLVAFGPSFRQRFRDPLPSGNVDLAPTIAAILGLDFHADGRVLREALVSSGHDDERNYSTGAFSLDAPRAATGLTLCYPTDPNCTDRYAGEHSYRARVVGKSLTSGEQRWLYFDHGEAIRD